MRSVFTCLLLAVAGGGLLRPLTAQAQRRADDDYVVTTAGDTLRGRIQLSGRAATIVHLHRRGQPVARYTASELRSYGTGRTPLRVSKPVGSPTGRPELLIPLVYGHVSLFAGKDPDYAHPRYYLQPADSAYVVGVPTLTSLLVYARLLSACPSLNIGSDGFLVRYPYTRGGHIALVTDYNRCLQKPSVLARAPAGVRVQLGAKGGIGFPTFTPIIGNYYAQAAFGRGAQNTASYQVGAVALFTTRSHWGLQVEGTYLRLRADYPVQQQPAANQGNYLGLYGAQVRFSQVQVVPLVHYTIVHGRTVRPYLNLGPSVTVNVGNNSVKQPVDAYANPLPTQPLDIGSGAILGAAAGVGCLVRPSGWPALLLEGRFDEPLDRTGRTFTTRSLRLEAGVLF